MNTREYKTQGLLLRKTLLPNDDAFLEFFTSDFGKISLSVRRFAGSKKKAAEIDFFRILELEIKKGRNTLSLKNATAIQLFPVFSKTLGMNKKGFEWLNIIRKITSENQNDEVMFQKIKKVFSFAESEWEDYFDIFFRIKMLDFSGFFVRFDLVRGDTYFDPLEFSFFSQNTPRTIFISNKTRQIIEFIRRSNFEIWFSKKEKLPGEENAKIQKIILEIEQKHY